MPFQAGTDVQRRCVRNVRKHRGGAQGCKAGCNRPKHIKPASWNVPSHPTVLSSRSWFHDAGLMCVSTNQRTTEAPLSSMYELPKKAKRWVNEETFIAPISNGCWEKSLLSKIQLWVQVWKKVKVSWLSLTLSVVGRESRAEGSGLSSEDVTLFLFSSSPLQALVLHRKGDY